jgi:glycosyltransferase involved in cell wall biosynthesis
LPFHLFGEEYAEKQTRKVKMRVLVAIPCFNEESHISETVRSLKTQLSKLIDSLDLIVFDDSSTDNSVEAALQAGAVVHTNRTNRGLGNNFNNIVNHALAGNYDYLLTCDGDGQFPPNEVEKVLSKALVGDYDLVLASRFINKEWSNFVPKTRRFGNRVVREIVKIISGKRVSDATCGLRVYDKHALAILNPNEKFSYTVESITQLLLANVKVLEVPIQVLYFENRKSTISGSLFKYGVKTISIASRLAISIALTRMLRKSAWLLAIGIFLEILFFYQSHKSGQFSGNLYLGLSGAMIFTIGLGSFFFYLISSKLDQNISLNLKIHRNLIAAKPLCADCKSLIG